MKKRAISLLEVVLVSSLLLTILTLALQILLPVLQGYQKSDRRSTLIQQVSAALDKLESEVADSNIRGLQFVENSLVVQPLGPPGSGGASFWWPELHVFSVSQNQMRFHIFRSKQLSQHTIAEPFPLLAPELAGVVAAPPSSILLVAGLENFAVTGLEPEKRSLPLNVTLGAVSSGGEKFELTRQFAPRQRPSR